ncbi:MAG: glycosyltransferase [Nitrososphaerales archaeon]
MLKNYRSLIGRDEEAEIQALADRLRGSSILHVNSTKVGGGVAEILKSLVPLAKSVGLKATWDVITGENEFYKVTKRIHNALQGMDLALTAKMRERYLKVNQDYAKNISFDQDVVMIHDAQPAAMIRYAPRNRAKWLWRCHIDLSKANQNYWRFIKQFVGRYDALIFSLEMYLKQDVRNKPAYIMTPCIDPLSEKNKELGEKQIRSLASKIGVDTNLPTVTQVSRFDPWKDPLGVIDTYRILRRKIPNLQLLMVGGSADDDPEGAKWMKKILKYVGKDQENGIHILPNLNDLEVNAVQRVSDVIIQKSIREGFAITVTEALWKGVPVVATRVGGIPLQVIDGVTGYLIDSAEDASDRILSILQAPDKGRRLGNQGKEHIRRNFLITGHLKHYLKVHLEIMPN